MADDDLNATLRQAHQALALGTGNLDDPRITGNQPEPSSEPWNNDPIYQSQSGPWENDPIAQNGPSGPWDNDPIYTNGYATKFADQGDLAAYHRARANGASEQEALQVGDNGIGNDDLGTVNTPNTFGVAVPREQLQKQLGNDPAAWRTARAMVTVNGHRAVVPIVDIGPGTKAQSRGVVTDLTGPLASAMGSSGFDPVGISLVRNAGPDYLTDRKGWYAEQQRIASQLPNAGPWNNDPVQGQASAGPKATADQPWLNDPVVDASQTRSGFRPASNAVASEQQPQKPADQTFDIGKAWQNLFSTGSEAASGLDVAGYKQALNRAESGQEKPTLFGTEQEREDEQLKNPNISQADAEEIIEKRRQRTQMDAEIAQKDLAAAESEHAKAIAANPGPEYQKTIPGTITRFLGQAAPYLFSGSLGAAAPFAVATQFSQQAYGDTFDRSMEQGRKAHPDWSDEQLRQAADEAARGAAQTGFENGVVMGLLPVPKVGPLMAQLVERVGFRGAYMAFANASQDIEQNIEVKKVDPQQAIYDGVLQHVPQNFLAGAVFEAPGAIGEGIGALRRPQETPQAEPGIQTTTEQEPTQNEPLKAAPVEENGEAVNVEAPSEQQTSQPAQPPEETPPGPSAPDEGRLPEPVRNAQGPPAWEALSEPERQSVVSDVRHGVETSVRRYLPFFDALDIPIVEQKGGRLSIAPTEAGGVFRVDPAGLAEEHYSAWKDDGIDYRDQSFWDKSVEEELIHAAWMNAHRQRWQAEGSRGSFLDYHYNEAHNITEDFQEAIHQAVTTDQHDLAQVLEQGQKAFRGLYNYGDESENAMSGAHQAAELVRMLVQLKNSGRITEDFTQPIYKRVLSHIANYFETARQRLIELWNRVSNRTSNVPSLEHAVEETTQRLRDIGYLERPKPKTTPEIYQPEPNWDVPKEEPKQPKISKAQAAWEEEQRQAAISEAINEARGGANQSQLLTTIQRSGGLPTPKRLRELVEAGETMTGEVRRVYDAWKSLSQDDKLWLKKKGVMASKLFRNDAPPLDEMRGNVSQHAGFAYGRVDDLLSEVEDAIALAKERRLGLGTHYAEERGRYSVGERQTGAERYTPGGEPLAYHALGTLAEKLLLPNREVVAKAPHTEELIRNLDEFRAGEGALQGKVAELSHLYKTLKRRNPGFDKEIDQIGKYVEKNRALPAQMSPEARTWLKAANNGLYREIGDRMRAGGFKTLMPDGSTRPFIGAPKDATPMPRVMRPDVQRVLSGRLEDGSGNFTPEARKIYQEGVREGYFQTPDDFKAWARQYRLDHSERPNITNLERARTTKYPSFFYTYSPQAMLDRLFWQSSELSRLETFGQKLPGQTDSFDRGETAINGDLSMSRDRKQHAIEAIGALRRTIYGQNKRSAAVRLLRGVSSAGLAGSPHTSAKIGLSMLFNVPAYRGIGRTLMGIADHVFRHGQSLAELRRLGLGQDVAINLHDDPYSAKTAERRASNIFTGVLKAAGHALAQDVGKAVTMRASKLWLEDAIKTLQADPALRSAKARQIAEDISRRGIDPRQFMQQNISQELKDRFVREDVNDLQTAYRPEDYPAWQASGMGSVMFQFGHWAYNGARAITRDAVIPMMRAFGRGDVLLGSRYFARVAGISLAAGGAAEAWRELDQLFGRQPAVATIGEIMQAFIRNSPDAAHMLVARMMEDALTSPVLGTFGDVANLGRNVTRGAAGETHFFNPAAPAAVGYLTIIASAVNQAFQQGGRLSRRQLINVLSQLAALPKGYYDVANTVAGGARQVTGLKSNEIPLPGHAEAMGRRENMFVRSRLDLFYEMHPEFDKRQKGGSYAGNAHTPYLQDLNEALLAGNAADARSIIRDYRMEQHMDPKTLATSLRESVNAHRPVPGGTAGQAFTRWATRNLTPEELQRMRAIERTYEGTAQRAGVSLSLEPSEYAPGR
jgi:hypothetical protein